MLPPAPVIRMTSLEEGWSSGAWRGLIKFVENGLRLGSGQCKKDAIVYRDGMREDGGGRGAGDGDARGAAAQCRACRLRFGGRGRGFAGLERNARRFGRAAGSAQASVADENLAEATVGS